MYEFIGVVIVGAVLVVIAFIFRTFWRTITDPKVAKHLGGKTRSAIDKSANAAGQVSGTIETVAKSARVSFLQGRDAARPKNLND